MIGYCERRKSLRQIPFSNVFQSRKASWIITYNPRDNRNMRIYIVWFSKMEVHIEEAEEKEAVVG